MKRWTHGHSLATGTAGGLLLSQRASTLLVCLVVGAVLGRLWWYESRLAHYVASRVRRSRVLP
jgi:hypothetical protein